MGHQNGSNDKKNRCCCGFHPQSQARNDVRSSTSLRVTSNPACRRACLRCVILGDLADEDTSEETRDDSDEDSVPCVNRTADSPDSVGQKEVTTSSGGHDHQGRSHIHAAVESMLREIEAYQEVGVTGIRIGCWAEDIDSWVSMIRTFAKEVMPRFQ